MRSSALAIVLLAVAAPAWPQAQNRGYYRFPAIYGQNVVFTAEGDLWEVGTEGGTARRLTTHPGEEMHAAFSPDGKTIAFSANYEGPTEVYTMPATGGLPSRRIFDGNANVVGWTVDGKILYSTRRYSTLPGLPASAGLAASSFRSGCSSSAGSNGDRSPFFSANI